MVETNASMSKCSKVIILIVLLVFVIGGGIQAQMFQVVKGHHAQMLVTHECSSAERPPRNATQCWW